MTNLALFDSGFCARVCMTLFHSVWQVAALCVFLWLVERIWRRLSVESLYVLNVAAIFLAIAALPVTYLSISKTTKVARTAIPATPKSTIQSFEPFSLPNPEAEMPEDSSGAIGAVASGAPADFHSDHAIHGQSPATADYVMRPRFDWRLTAPWIAGGYAMGVAVMLIRLFTGVAHANRLGRLAKPITDGPLWERLQQLSRQWSLAVVPVLAETTEVVVPKVVGFLRPTILVPAAALTGMSTDELEMVLIHELSHVRRHDLWVNLVQRLAEILLFFNPALWFLSKRVSGLREFCCDDLACRILADNKSQHRLSYATALVKVVELARPNLKSGNELVSLAASGRGPSELRRRVSRLLGETIKEPFSISWRTLAAFAIVATGLAVAGSAIETSEQIPNVVAKSTDDSNVGLNVRLPVVELQGDFARQAAGIVSAALSKSGLSFATDDYCKAVNSKFAATIRSFSETGRVKMDTVSDERRVAILTSLRDNATQLLGLKKNRMDELSRVDDLYLRMPDKIKTIQWLMFMAMSRPELDDAAKERLKEQRAWMRKMVRAHSDDELQMTLLEEHFSDPLNAVHDQPITDAEFEFFRQNVSPILLSCASYMTIDLFGSIWRDRKNVPLFDADATLSRGGSGGERELYLGFGFKSNQRFKGQSKTVGKGSIFDIRTGEKAQVLQNPKYPSWYRDCVISDGLGDFTYNAERDLQAIHGAKILQLAEKSWVEIDRISDEELRRRIRTNGGEKVSLEEFFESIDIVKGLEGRKRRSGDFISVLNERGELAVVELDRRNSFGSGLHLRIRPRPLTSAVVQSVGGSDVAVSAAEAGTTASSVSATDEIRIETDVER